VRAQLLTGTRKMEMKLVPDLPEPAPNEVRVAIGAVGVCGSDVHYYLHGRIGDQVIEGSFAVGHEGAGIIENVGEEVENLRPGDRVAFDPAMPCYACDQCLSGRLHTCRHLRFLGCPGQAEGCLKDAILMPAKSVFKIPDSMSLEEAALAEPLSIAVYAAKLAAEDLDGKRVGVLGFGPIGMSVAMVSQRHGASLFVSEKIAERRKQAESLGAEAVADPDSLPLSETLCRTPSGDLDIVFECSGDPAAWRQGVNLLKPGGKLMVIGIPSGDEVPLDPHLLRRKEIAIQNVRRQNGCMQEAIDLIATKQVPASRMITHRYPFELTADGFEQVAHYRDGIMKAIIEFGLEEDGF
jgi:L-iditol 2-dehydrogenase